MKILDAWITDNWKCTVLSSFSKLKMTVQEKRITEVPNIIKSATMN
jgi:hypothetical protein